MVKKQQKQKQAKKQPKKQAPKKRMTMSAPSTINTAPVAIGNSMRGSQPVVMQTTNGARVIGRDFAFAASSTVAAITDWELIGGMPLTPAVLVSSVLRNFNQIYNKFKFNRLIVHYITSSPTTQAGDVLIYYEKNRNSPCPDYTNSSFLNFVMSDGNTVLGPQWTNHSALIVPTSDFKTTDFGITQDTDDDNQGSVYFFSKTNAANSPGYILIDYDITFKELSVTPRAGLFPVTRGLFSQICLTATSAGVTLGVTSLNQLSLTTGKILNGVTSVLPTGYKNNDIYKFVANVTGSTSTGVNAAWTGVNTTNLLVNNFDTDTAVTIEDGFTCYLRLYDPAPGGGNQTFGALYPTLTQAVNANSDFRYGVTTTVTFNLVGSITFMTNTSSVFTEAVY